mgnify:CR=1 FL=1
MRLIAKLDVKPPYVVKPVHFEGLRKVGSPKELADKYYQQGADEIFYIDIVASLYRREVLFSQVREAAKDLFVPLGAGGGIRTIEDCINLFHNGADKVIINSFAIQEDPSIIDKAAKLFGAQSVVINIEAKHFNGDWYCFSDCGRVPSERKVISWVTEAQNRGAGEVLLQSIDTDGRQRGFDLDLAQQVAAVTTVPLVIASGAGTLDDIVNLARTVNPSGIAIASMLHYNKLTISEIKTALDNVNNQQINQVKELQTA